MRKLVSVQSCFCAVVLLHCGGAASGGATTPREPVQVAPGDDSPGAVAEPEEATDPATTDGAASEREFVVVVEAPDGPRRYTYSAADLEDLLEGPVPASDLMTNLGFQNPDLAIDFLTVLDGETGEQTHSIRSLVGVASTDEQRWVFYINGERHEWHDVCERTMRPEDELIWRFE